MTDGRVERALAQRLGMLALSNPDISTEWAIINDEWGLITISAGTQLLGYEYVESGLSWSRAGKVKMYEETLRRGLSALVVVPEEAYLPLRMRLCTTMSVHQPVVLSYDCLGVSLTPRPS